MATTPRLGDGELLAVSEVDTARQTIHATADEIRTATGRNLDGLGIIVGVIDTGIRHNTAFSGRILAHVLCDSMGCNSTNPSNIPGLKNPYHIITSHGTQVAQVLAASGLPEHNGIAPGVHILDIRFGEGASGIAHGLDYALRNNADVVNMSFRILGSTLDAWCHQNIDHTTSLDLIVNESVDKNMVAVKSAGNEGSINGAVTYESITNPGCGSNVISVGGINDRGPGSISMYDSSSRGPAGGTVILKPEIVAPATNIQTLSFIANSTTDPRNGTSYAAPQVSATAAMLLQLRTDWTPIEVKAALLVGANWTGPVPCTASEYELGGANRLCSHDYKPTNQNFANGPTGLGIINNVGFGILDTAKSLEYAADNTHPNIISDQSTNDFPDQQYRIYAQQDDRVKVIMSWLVHPRGTILDPQQPFNSPHVAPNDQYHDYNLSVTFPDGTKKTSDSEHQTNEFVVFDAPQTGYYNIIVSSDGSTITKLNEPYAIASTHPIDKYPFETTPPPTIPPPTIPPPTTPPTTSPDVITSFTDNFQNDLSLWTMSGDSNWTRGGPDENIPNSDAGNRVLVSSNCRTECIATLNSSLDTSSPLVISFKRFVNNSVDRSEGLYIQYSTDGTNWINLATYTEDNNENTDAWVDESLTLDISDDTASFRLLAKSSSVRETVEVDDLSIAPRPDTAPVISSISDQSLRHTQVRNISVTATDAENDAIALSLVSPPDFVTMSGTTIRIDPASSDVGTHTITVKATANGKSDTERFTVTVTGGGGGGGGGVNPPPPPDTTPPIVTAPADVAFEAAGARTTITAAQLGTAAATDNADPSPAITNDAPASFPLGITIVTWTATDDSGNTATDTQSVTIRDTTPPTIPARGDITRLFEPGTAHVVTFDVPAAADTVDPDVAVSCTPEPGSVFAPGTTTVTCTATDDSGNAASTSFGVTVSVSAPAPPISLNLRANATANSVTLTWDIPDDDTIAGFDVRRSDAANSWRFHFISYESADTFTYTDPHVSAGNSFYYHVHAYRDGFDRVYSQTIRVAVGDTVAPVLAIPGDKVFEATGVLTPLTSNDYGNATVTDNYDQSITVANNATSTFPLGNTIISWTATDSSGNIATGTQTITVQDTTPPAITAPGDATFEATDTSMVLSQSDYGAATATDLVDSSPVITSNATGSFPVGTTTTILWTATDFTGNSASATQTITVRTVQDAVPPVISLNGYDLVVVEQQGEFVETATATDNTDGDISGKITIKGTVDTDTIGEYVLTYDVQDSSKNHAEQKTRTVAVVESIFTVCAAGCNHTSIREAVGSATTGDAVVIADSREYNESLDINVDGLFLVSSASPRPLIWSNLTGHTVEVYRASNVTLANLAVKYNGTSYAHAVYAIIAESPRIANSDIRNLGLGAGIHLNLDTDFAKIYGNVVSVDNPESISSGMTVHGDDSTITNNTVYTFGRQSNSGMFLTGYGMTITDNLIYPNGTGNFNKGIYFLHSHNSTADGNTISTYGVQHSKAIRVDHSENVTVSNNSIVADGERFNDGMYVRYSTDIAIHNNTISTDGLLYTNTGLQFFNTHKINATHNTIFTDGYRNNCGISITYSDIAYSVSNYFAHNHITPSNSSPTNCGVSMHSGYGNNTFYDDVIDAPISPDVRISKYPFSSPNLFSGESFMVSVDFDENGIYFGPDVTAKVFVQNRLDLQVLDGSSLPVANATITIADSPGVDDHENPTSHISLITNSTGHVPQQVLTKFMANSTFHNANKLVFNNYTVGISKDGLEGSVPYTVVHDALLKITIDGNATKSVTYFSSPSRSPASQADAPATAAGSSGASGESSTAYGNALIAADHSNVESVMVTANNPSPFVNEYVHATCYVSYDDSVHIPHHYDTSWNINGTHAEAFDNFATIVYSADTVGNVELQCTVTDAEGNSASSDTITVGYVERQ